MKAPVLRALLVAASLAAVGVLAWALALRAGYPYDLEWMEGGILCHALRIARDQPLYGPPSVDFIPFLYTPLYPWLVAKLGGASGIGYGLGRAISLLSFVGTLLLGYVFARRGGGSRVTALLVPGITCAAFVPTGAWFDLARPDTLFMFLVTAALFVGYWGRKRPAITVLAGLLMVAAFFTKQTASPFMVGLGFVLLILSWRAALLYGMTLALVGLPALYWANRATEGWFWTYVFRLHQLHDFYPLRAFIGSPLRLLLIVGPAVLLVPWALLRRRNGELTFAVMVAIFGTAAACLGFGTQWAFTNAFIPGVFFPAVAIATAAGRLVFSDQATRPPRMRPSVVYLLSLATLVSATGLALPWASRRAPRSIGLPAEEPTAMQLRRFVPTARDTQEGAELVARLKAAPGEVMIPFHPFYAHLAGKRTYVHRMGVMDVGRAGLGAPRGLQQALAEKRFSLLVMDDKLDGTAQQWPGLYQAYRVTGHVGGPRCFSGAMTHPRDLLEPIAPVAPVVVDPPEPTEPDLP